MRELINQRDAEGRAHGLWEYYRPDGTLWKVHWHQGKRHGVWEGYWNNGKRGRRVHWHYGVMKGLDTWWDSQGRCTQKRYHLVIR